MHKEDLRVARTKNDIENKLTDLLLQRPFSKITVKQICEEALINRGTFYRYYQDKYDLLMKVFKRLTVSSDKIDIIDLLHSPREMINMMMKKPLLDIFHKQYRDIEFEKIERNFYIQYYSKALNSVKLQNDIPKDLFIYILVDMIISFENWQNMNQLELKDSEYDEYFTKLLNIKSIV